MSEIISPSGDESDTLFIRPTPHTSANLRETESKSTTPLCPVINMIFDDGNGYKSCPTTAFSGSGYSAVFSSSGESESKLYL